MDLGSIFLILALLVLVGWFVARPLFEESKISRSFISGTRTGQPAIVDSHELSSLLAERDRILNSLHELDFDNVLGKIPAEDYTPQRAVLLQKGADILRRLEELQVGDTQVQKEIDEQMEAAIAIRRADILATQTANGNNRARGVSAAIASPDDDLEVMLANRRRERVEKAAGFCPKCGRALQQSDRFCPKCGAKIA